MPDTVTLDLERSGQMVVEALAEGLLAVRLLEWARQSGPQALLYIARSDTRAQRLARALRGLAPKQVVVVLPPWDCLPYDRAGPSREAMGRRIAALRQFS